MPYLRLLPFLDLFRFWYLVHQGRLRIVEYMLISVTHDVFPSSTLAMHLEVGERPGLHVCPTQDGDVQRCGAHDFLTNNVNAVFYVSPVPILPCQHVTSLCARLGNTYVGSVDRS
jgi:hypothetical protein